MSIFDFKFIHEGERLQREMAVQSELVQISLENPHLSVAEKDDATFQAMKNSAELMADHIIFIHKDLIKTKGINLALSSVIVLYGLARWINK